jgi:2-oxoisovalerate dehydrogenase E1 component alpha subunit
VTGDLERLRQADEALSAQAVPFPLPIGELAPVVAGAVSALGSGDWWVPSMRERAGAVLRGVPLERLYDVRLGAKPYKVAPPSTSPALRALVAVGLAVAHPGSAVLVHLGIGSASDGAFHEALNLAALLRPHVIFLVTVHPLTAHPLTGDAPLGRQLAPSPAELARTFGLSATETATDIDAVHRAVASARATPGPHLVQANLLRKEDST